MREGSGLTVDDFEIGEEVVVVSACGAGPRGTRCTVVNKTQNSGRDWFLTVEAEGGAIRPGWSPWRFDKVPPEPETTSDPTAYMEWR